MTTNIKYAFRFLKKNIYYTVINIIGLSISLAISFIILLHVINEVSYNKMHKKNKNIYRVNGYYTEFDVTLDGTPYLLASTLKKEYPYIESSINLKRVQDLQIKYNNEYITINSAFSTNSDVFNIFTIPLIEGKYCEKPLEDIYSICISRSLASKLGYVGSIIGSHISVIINKNEYSFVITGVFEDTPLNSTINADCFINSLWGLNSFNPSSFDEESYNSNMNWENYFWSTWLLIDNNTRPEVLEKEINMLAKMHLNDTTFVKYTIQNLNDVYFGSNHIKNTSAKGNIRSILFLVTISIIIIIIGFLNYIIITLSITIQRAREIGIRKTFGAEFRHINQQLFLESVLLFIVIMPFILYSIYLCLPVVKFLFNYQLEIVKSNIVTYLLIYTSITLLLSILYSSYTSFWYVRKKTNLALLSRFNYGKNKKWIQSLLIFFQLLFFCIFISSAQVIHSQYLHSLKKDAGYNTKNIIFVKLETNNSYSKFVNILKPNPNIIEVGGVMSGLPIRGEMLMKFSHSQFPGKKVIVQEMVVDYNFLQTMNIQLINGRYFSEDFPSDINNSCILNETAVEKLGYIEPIGEKIGPYKIVGVVKDFNTNSIQTPIPALIITLSLDNISEIAIHYYPTSFRALLPELENNWDELSLDTPFTYTTIEALTKELYSNEHKLSVIVAITSIFALIISVIGLIGMTQFIIKIRTKEIGIRKVLGASNLSILLSFLKHNVLLVSLAFLLSIPVTYFFVSHWLNNYINRVTIEWLDFLLTFLLTTTIVSFIVIFQSYKTAIRNPVETLKYE